MTIAEEVAYNLKIPKERVELVIRSFNDGLRFYVNNPLESKGKIKIDGLMNLKIRKRSVLKMIELEKGNKEYYEKLLNIINERQTSKKI